MDRTIATPGALRDLMQTLRADGAAPVVAVRGPGAVALVSAALADQSPAPSVDPDKARYTTDQPLWLHDGPGARALADARSTLCAVASDAPSLYLTGPCADAGVPGAATAVWADAAGLLPGEVSPTEMVGSGGHLATRFADGDLLGAQLAWERGGCPPEGSWVEALRHILFRRYRAAYDQLATQPDCAYGWRLFAWSYLAFQLLDYRTVRALVDHAALHPDRVGPAATAALCATRALIDGLPLPEGTPPWMVAYDAHVHGKPPPAHHFAQVLDHQVTHPRPAIGRGVVTNSHVRSIADPLAMVRLRDVWARHDAGERVTAREVPPPSVLGVFERAGCLVRGQLALADDDHVTLRQCAEALPRTSALVMPRAMLQGAVQAKGQPWARRVWLEALRRTYGEALPELEPALVEARAEARMLDDYELVHIIGEGSAGAVWEAVHRPTGEAVAIKTLTVHADVEAFRREIELVSRLEHPAIAAVLDRGVVTDPELGSVGAPYLVMELVRGGTLDSRRGRLPWVDIQSIVLALLDALAYAHAAGVLHRDLKPVNVLVSHDRTVRLSDFGLAALPRRGAIAGTPAFMAPEQLQGEARVESDLYALAVLVWSLCTKRSPLPNSLEARRAHDPADIGAFSPRIPVPTGLETLLRKALAPSPRHRFRSAAAMATAWEALGPARGSVPLGPSEAPPPSEATTGTPRDDGSTFVLHELLDLDATDDEGTASTFSRTGGLWELPVRTHWRPRLPTPRLLGAGDPPLLFREGAQATLWGGLVRASLGEAVHVHLVAPPQTGRRHLLDWLARHGAASGLRHSEELLHVVDGPQAPRPLPAGTLCVTWSPTPEPTAATTDTTTVLELPPYTPMQVFWMLRSRVRVPALLAIRGARFACRRPHVAMLHLQDWLHDPGAAPGPRGLQLLRTPTHAGPRAAAFWKEEVARLSPETRRSWALLASQAAGFTAQQALEVLPAMGLPPVEPGVMAAPEPNRWQVPSALAAALDPADPAQVAALAEADDSSFLHQLFTAIVRGDDPWEALARLPFHKRIDPLVRQQLWRLAMDRGDAPYHAVWRLRLAESNQPLFHAHEALGRGDHLGAAMAYARANVGGRIPMNRDEHRTLRQLYDRLSSAEARSHVAAALAYANVGVADEATERWLLAEEARGEWSTFGRCLVRRSVAQRRGELSEMVQLLEVARALEPESSVAELLISAVILGALDRDALSVAEEARHQLGAPGYLTGHIAAALFAARQLRVREAKSELERAFVTNPADNAFVDLGWCLWLGLDIDAPTARWNDLHDELVAPPSRALAVALRALAQHHASGRAEQLRALAQRSDRPVV